MPFERIHKITRRVAVLIGLAASLATRGAASVPAYSQAPQAPATAYARPDVQVLIVHAGDALGGDLVSLVYPKLVPPAQAEGDVTAILHAGGWRTSDVDISNDALPVKGAAGVPMTSVTFEVSGAMPRAGQTTLHLEPWVMGLKQYPSLAVAYLLPAEFKFDGLRSYRDSHVLIDLDEERTTLTYHVRVLDGGRFSSLGLPLTQAEAQAAEAQRGGHGLTRLKALGILMVGLAALGVGYAVYILMSRLH